MPFSGPASKIMPLLLSGALHTHCRETQEVTHLNVFFLIVLCLVLALLETRFALRFDAAANRRQRWKTNAIAFVLASLVSSLMQYVLIAKIEEIEFKGLFRFLEGLDQDTAYSTTFIWLGIGIQVLVLDLYLYVWHRLNHKVTFFWRFHQFHHLDPYMDVTTALRFHPGEILLSQLLKFGFFLCMGISKEAALIFQTLVTASALFHHSNIRLSTSIESFLAPLLVTPRHHQNHHSWFLEETDSNYGAIFSFWDIIFNSKTFCQAPSSVTIGVPTHSAQTVNSMSIFRQILTPFQRIKRWPNAFLQRK